MTTDATKAAAARHRRALPAGEGVPGAVWAWGGAMNRHCSEDDVCDDCHAAANPQPNPDTTCHCCKWCDDGEDVSDRDAVINNNGYCPGCRDAECGEQQVGAKCRAVAS